MLRRIFCIFLCLSFVILPVRGEEKIKYVALTFDDGPSGRFTRRLLDGLEERGVKATFLLCGYRLKDYPKEAQRILREGHEIGLHGYSHDDMSKMDAQQLKKELRDTAALLPEGCNAVFLRPPGGASGATVRAVAREEGLALLNWSVDPRDWATHDAAAVTAAVVESVTDGDVILLHDMCDCSVDAAFRIIDRLTKEGFRFLTVSQLAEKKGITPEPGEMYYRFP